VVKVSSGGSYVEMCQ